MKTIDVLSRIQGQLKVPKNQYNNFGKYKYRSCEDILEAIKPFIEDIAIICISDEIILIGDRYYVKATVSIQAIGDQNIISVSAYARETQERKGMDESQITGSASSYARKYALNGIFCIDDTKDADSNNNNNNNNIFDIEANIKKINNSDKLNDYWKKNYKSWKENKNDLEYNKIIEMFTKRKKMIGG